MPQRLLKPGLKDSMRFNSCSWPAQSLFVRLIMVVDDYGRFDAHPLQLARILFPFGRPSDGRPVREEEMTDWLAELVKAKMLVLYMVREGHFLELTRWTERIRSRQSRFPAPLAGTCQQMLSDASNCQQPTANAALPPSASTSTSTPTPTVEKKGAGASDGPSRLQWAALKARVVLAKRDESPEARRVVEKMEAALEHIQKKQADGDYSLTDLTRFGLKHVEP